MTRPNERVVQVGLHLANQDALVVAQALSHLALEQSVCDGWATRGDSAGRGSAASSTTEAAAIMAGQFHHKTDDIRQAIANLEADRQHLARLASESLGLRAPAALAEIRCRDSQMGRQGALEWGDPTCEELPVKAGLCGACYQRERRWRVGHGLTAREIEPART